MLILSEEFFATLQRITGKNKLISDINRFYFNIDDIDYLDLEYTKDGLYITYLRNKIIQENEELATSRFIKTREHLFFYNEKREKGRFGKTIRKIVPGHVDEGDLKEAIEYISALYNNKDLTVSVVTGEDMVKYFNAQSYIPSERRNSTLWKSCMRHDAVTKHFGIYVNNPNLSMVIATDKDGKLHARALLYNNVNVISVVPEVETPFTKPVSVMDRIYFETPAAASALMRWAKETDVVFKHFQPRNPLLFVHLPSNTIHEAILTQPLKTYKYDKYPYVDTFHVYNITEGHLSNKFNGNWDDDTRAFSMRNLDVPFEPLTENSPRTPDKL